MHNASSSYNKGAQSFKTQLIEFLTGRTLHFAGKLGMFCFNFGISKRIENDFRIPYFLVRVCISPKHNWQLWFQIPSAFAKITTRVKIEGGSDINYVYWAYIRWYLPAWYAWRLDIKGVWYAVTKLFCCTVGYYGNIEWWRKSVTLLCVCHKLKWFGDKEWYKAIGNLYLPTSILDGV